MLAAQPAAALPASPTVPTAEKLRILLLAAALIKLISTASDAAVLFGDTTDIAVLTIAGIALAPFLSAVALVLAARSSLPGAISAMAGTILCNWLGDLVAFVLNGLGTDDNVVLTLLMVLQLAGYPLMAASAIALAARRRSLATATALVLAPMAITAIGMLLFAAGIAIYGF